ncbi:MAG: hypothetical protein C4318_08075 [Acidimicrobiia bacterium]
MCGGHHRGRQGAQRGTRDSYCFLLRACHDPCRAGVAMEPLISPKTRVATAAVAFLLLIGAGSPAKANVSGAGSGALRAGVAFATSLRSCRPFTFRIDGVPSVANPFDPQQIDVVARFQSGSRVYDVPAFYTQDYQRSRDASGAEILQPQGNPYWAVRFTPPAGGTWNWEVTIRRNGSLISIQDKGQFLCDSTDHGPLRRHLSDPKKLEHADGTPYLAMGENLGWYGPGGTFDYDAWLDRLAAQGATWIRVWMASWSFGLEGIRRDSSGAVVETSLGNYTARLDRAWQLDYVIEAARARGIATQLVIQYHGPFSLTTNSEWADNPYNSANGGPISDPALFFTDPTSRQLVRQRLRYIVARWGYADNVIWELWNEVDLTAGQPNDILTWHDEMFRYLDSLDWVPHLRTTSISEWLDFLQPLPRWAGLWSNPLCDLVQIHLYGQGANLPIDFTRWIPALVGSASRSFGKPVLMGEAGVDARGPTQTLAADPLSLGIHELVWAGLFADSYGTGMTWWWDNLIHPLDLYATIGSPKTLVSDPPLSTSGLSSGPATATSADGASLYGAELRGERTRLAWVRNPNHWWFRPDFSQIQGAILRLAGMEPGAWRVRFYDPYTGRWIGDAPIEVGLDGALSLNLPTFQGEIAVRADRVEQKMYFAEGAAVDGLFETWLLLQNPSSTLDALAAVKMLRASGPPIVTHVAIPSSQRVSLRIGSYLQDFEVAFEVDVLKGTVEAERALYSVHPDRPGATLASGIETLSQRWFSAEGAADGPFETWLLLANPAPQTVTATVTFHTDSGVRPGPTVDLSPSSRRTLKVNDYVGAPTYHVSSAVDASSPIVVERAVYKRNPAWSPLRGSATADVAQPQPSTIALLPEGSTAGFETWYLIANPSENAASVTITPMTSSGPGAGLQLRVPQASRVSVRANDYWPNLVSLGAVVESDIAVFVETAQYGLDGAFAGTAHSTAPITKAVKAWDLPEGATAGGFRYYVQILDPSDTEANCTLRFVTAEEATLNTLVVVSPRTRQTFAIHEMISVPSFDVHGSVECSVPVAVAHTLLSPPSLSGDSTSSPAIPSRLV